MRPVRPAPIRAILLFTLLAGVATDAAGQQRFSALPGAEDYRQVARATGRLATGGVIGGITWLEDGSGVEYTVAGVRYRTDFETGETEETTVEEAGAQGRLPEAMRRRVRRGRQASSERSPDGVWNAVCRDDNVVLERVDGTGEEIVVTTGGHRKQRYGRASWVYGEELDQNTAMWWSPDGRYLAFYAFDERSVPDYYLLRGLTEQRTSPMIEGYPKPGDPNPIAGLRIYDLEDAETITVDVGPETDQYVFDVRFSPDSSLLLFNRTTRLQNRLELVGADPATGASRVVHVEEQPTWQDNHPEIRFLEDGRRFIWASERTGWKQYELRDLDGRLLHPLTSGEYPANSILRVDEDEGVLWYDAYSSENPLNLQVHRVNLDGTGQVRLTQDELNHRRVSIAPFGGWFTCSTEAVDVPPETVLFDGDGHRLATLARSDLSRMEELGLPMPELFTCLAADGRTPLYGVLYKPAGFDPSRTYPLLVKVYGGPSVRTVRNTFRGADPACALGMLVMQVDNRGTPGRGKAFESATYRRLGIVDLDDQAAAVRHLVTRPYVDGELVGITGGSYGGYLSALAMLRYPELFHCAAAVSAVTDWRNYDSIYTERYMALPADNPEGYDESSCVVLADRLQGPLLIMHGMADDNVHPANAWQLADVLQKGDYPFEMMFFPRAGHGIGGPGAQSARWGFLWRHLVGPDAGD